MIFETAMQLLRNGLYYGNVVYKGEANFCEDTYSDFDYATSSEWAKKQKEKRINMIKKLNIPFIILWVSGELYVCRKDIGVGYDEDAQVGDKVWLYFAGGTFNWSKRFSSTKTCRDESKFSERNKALRATSIAIDNVGVSRLENGSIKVDSKKILQDLHAKQIASNPHEKYYKKWISSRPKEVLQNFISKMNIIIAEEPKMLVSKQTFIDKYLVPLVKDVFKIYSLGTTKMIRQFAEAVILEDRGTISGYFSAYKIKLCNIKEELPLEGVWGTLVLNRENNANKEDELEL